MENYIQQSEWASLIKRGSFIYLAYYANYYLQNVLFTKYRSPIVNFWPDLQIFELAGKTCHGHTL
jgi:hypothetical protein